MTDVFSWGGCDIAYELFIYLLKFTNKAQDALPCIVVDFLLAAWQLYI